MTRLKVCCIASGEEARLAASLGADAVGLVSAMPSGPGVIDEALIAQIARQVPPPVARFLLSSAQDPEALLGQVQRTGVDTLQICDRVEPRAWSELRRRAPGLRLVQVVHVEDESAVDEALHAAASVHALLLDSGSFQGAVKELGGTGRRHDWSISRRIVERAPVPVFLAGGLRDDNVEEAVASVRPWGLDVCSGVRREGRLDAERLTAFVRAMRRAHEGSTG